MASVQLLSIYFLRPIIPESLGVFNASEQSRHIHDRECSGDGPNCFQDIKGVPASQGCLRAESCLPRLDTTALDGYVASFQVTLSTSFYIAVFKANLDTVRECCVSHFNFQPAA